MIKEFSLEIVEKAFLADMAGHIVLGFVAEPGFKRPIVDEPAKIILVGFMPLR